MPNKFADALKLAPPEAVTGFSWRWQRIPTGLSTSAANSILPFPSGCAYWRLRKTPPFKSCPQKRWSCISERGRPRKND